MIGYRPDIDGLRAIAVVSVVFFHAGVPPFSGGFVGVDVFFVISGFLITSLLLDDFSRNNFSVWRFYARRVRRIFPALLAILLFTLVAGFFLLLPSEFSATGFAARSVSYFLSNHFFWQAQQDYWQQNFFSSQPLLHTWSLAVEEQFYVIVPCLLAAYFRLARVEGAMRGVALEIVLVSLLIASFSWSVWTLKYDPAGAFYLLPARSWELLLGSELAVRTHHRQGAPRHFVVVQLAGLVGVGLILWAIFKFDGKTAFPGVNALLPSVGASLVIYAGSSTSAGWVSRLLSIRLIVFFGLISYSLYLWHWPLLVLFRSSGWHALGLPNIPTWMLLAMIFFVSWGSWVWIERPFRRVRADAAVERRTLGLAVGALILCYMLGTLSIHSGELGKLYGQPEALLAAQIDYDRRTTPGARCEGNPNLLDIRGGVAGCVLGASSLEGVDPSFAIFGDSHARMWTPALDQLARSVGTSGLGLTYSSCVPLVALVPPTRPECVDILREGLTYLSKSSIGNVVLAGYWVDAYENVVESNGRFSKSERSVFYQSLDATLSILAAAGKRVFIVLDVPELPSDSFPADKAIESIRNGGGQILGVSVEEHRKRQEAVERDIYLLRTKYNFILIDPVSLICPNTHCLVAVEGRALYRDKHHLTDWGAVSRKDVFSQLLVKATSY